MQTLTLLVAGHNPPPLVDIDNTVFVQLGIFILLFIILSRLVFRPYLSLRRAQHEHTTGAKSAAEELSARAAQKMLSYEELLVLARRQAAAARQQIREQTEAQAASQRAAARSRMEQIIESGRKALEQNVQKAEQELRARADEIAKAIAGKVLGREV